MRDSLDRAKLEFSWKAGLCISHREVLFSIEAAFSHQSLAGRHPAFSRPAGTSLAREGPGLGAGGKFTSLRSELEGATLQILVFMKNSTPFASGRKHDVICLGRLAVDLYAQQIGSRLEDVSDFFEVSRRVFGKHRLQLRAPWSEVRDANAGWRRSHGTLPD